MAPDASFLSNLQGTAPLFSVLFLSGWSRSRAFVCIGGACVHEDVRWISASLRRVNKEEHYSSSIHRLLWLWLHRRHAGRCKAHSKQLGDCIRGQAMHPLLSFCRFRSWQLSPCISSLLHLSCQSVDLHSSPQTHTRVWAIYWWQIHTMVLHLFSCLWPFGGPKMQLKAGSNLQVICFAP